MVHKYCENLLKILRDRQGVYSSRILSGDFKSLEEYKWCSGKLSGIIEAEDFVRSLFKDMFDSPRKDEANREDVEYERDYITE
jgi:hypothetical protein